jgi:hypothetical protein
MEAICSSEMSVDFQWTVSRSYIPEDRNFRDNSYENLEPNITPFLFRERISWNSVTHMELPCHSYDKCGTLRTAWKLCSKVEWDTLARHHESSGIRHQASGNITALLFPRLIISSSISFFIFIFIPFLLNLHSSLLPVSLHFVPPSFFPSSTSLNRSAPSSFLSLLRIPSLSPLWPSLISCWPLPFQLHHFLFHLTSLLHSIFRFLSIIIVILSFFLLNLNSNISSTPSFSLLHPFFCSYSSFP